MTELISMMVEDAMTVPNAIELFEQAKHLPVAHWGFKDQGVDWKYLEKLNEAFKKEGKTTYLEMMQTEAEGALKSAQFAVDCGVDVVIGMYTPEVEALLAANGMKYISFTGDLDIRVGTLSGSVQDVVDDSLKKTARPDVYSVIVAMHLFQGDANALLDALLENITKPLVISAGINSKERVVELVQAGVPYVVVGTAFMKKSFVPDGSFVENIEKVLEWMQ